MLLMLSSEALFEISRRLPVEGTVPIAGGHFGRCTVGFVHWLCGPLRFIFAPICI